MKAITTLGLIAAFSLSSNLSQAATYAVDAAHSSVSFAVTHMMISTVRGSLGGVSGQMMFDAKNPTASKLEVEVDVTTINTNNAKRDGHLKSPDFFDVGTHPKATFVSKSFKKAGKGKYKINGHLTIRGKTKPVTLTAKIGDDVKIYDDTKRPTSAMLTINRQDFGVNWNKSLDKGGVVVSNDVELTIDLQFNKQASDKKS